MGLKSVFLLRKGVNWLKSCWLMSGWRGLALRRAIVCALKLAFVYMGKILPPKPIRFQPGLVGLFQSRFAKKQNLRVLRPFLPPSQMALRTSVWGLNRKDASLFALAPS